MNRQQRFDKIIQCLDFYANCPKAYDGGALARRTLADVAQAEALPCTAPTPSYKNQNQNQNQNLPENACPQCGGVNFKSSRKDRPGGQKFNCRRCGYVWITES